MGPQPDWLWPAFALAAGPALWRTAAPGIPVCRERMRAISKPDARLRCGQSAACQAACRRLNRQLKKKASSQKQHCARQQCSCKLPAMGALPAPWPHVHMATGGLVPVHFHRPVPSLKNPTIRNLVYFRGARTGLPALRVAAPATGGSPQSCALHCHPACTGYQESRLLRRAGGKHPFGGVLTFPGVHFFGVRSKPSEVVVQLCITRRHGNADYSSR